MSYKGMIVPLVTPLSGRDSLDCESLERLLQHVIEGGVDGVIVLGTTGEAPSLSYRLRREMVERTCSIVDKMAPVLVGVTDTSSVESLNLAKWACERGADAVVLALPYYFPAGQPEILSYLKEIIPQIPLPVTLYNMPTMTKLTLEVDTVKNLLEVENIRGLKDSSGDLTYFKELVKLKRERPDWSLLCGTEHQLVESVRLGGDGGVNGGANIFPKLFSEAYRAASTGDTRRAGELSEKIEALQKIYTVGDYASRYLKGTKCALSILGICREDLAVPFYPFAEKEREQLRQVLAGLGKAELVG